MLVRVVGDAEIVVGHVMRLPGEVFDAPAGEVRRLTAGDEPQIEVVDAGGPLPFTESGAKEKGTAVTNAHSGEKKAHK